MRKTRVRTFAVAALLLAAAASLSACATQPMGTPGEPGFWSGLLHGAIAPWAFLYSVFIDPTHRLYAFPNSGRWYDFGFLFGFMFVYGGSGAAAAGRRKT